MKRYHTKLDADELGNFHNKNSWWEKLFNYLYDLIHGKPL